MADKLDPFDVAALERSVNDSAVRVSTIWVSFLIFALYLVVSAGTITHRQLLLEDPVKLPAINIDLPLWGFFFLAPILFVIFHAYVLLQVLLLGRTAVAYNEAVDRAVRPPTGNASMRQRLANTLFAQIFAGSPREREGLLGFLLKLMAWVTLAIAPVLVLLVFQFKFLPYHSHVVTWTHRLLIVVELATVFLLWPLTLDATRDIEWRRVVRQPAALVAVPLFTFISLSLATFPGEPHVNLFTGSPLLSVECDRWIPRRLDRLDLTGEQLVDSEKLAKIERDTAARGLLAAEGERTRNFRDRDLTCGLFRSADLRRTDFSGAEATDADFEHAELQGASFNEARLQAADFQDARLEDASFKEAYLQGSSFDDAQLQGANLSKARLQGAWLSSALLQGANLSDAQLQGASLAQAQLQGARLWNAQLQGADLDYAQLQGSVFGPAQLEGASLESAHLQGAYLSHTRLQGANFAKSDLSMTWLEGAFVWRAKFAHCEGAYVLKPRIEPVIELRRNDEEEDKAVDEKEDKAVEATRKAVEEFIERALAGIPENRQADARKRMRDGLILDREKDDAVAIDNFWRDCAASTASKTRADIEKETAEYFRDLVCNAPRARRFIARGIVEGRIFDNPKRSVFARTLARGLLDLDGRGCTASLELETNVKARLQPFANAPPD